MHRWLARHSCRSAKADDSGLPLSNNIDISTGPTLIGIQAKASGKMLGLLAYFEVRLLSELIAL